jgi:hypothetical protein
VSEQETRQEHFLPHGQKIVPKLLQPQSRESMASSGCGFLPPEKIGRL